MNPSAGNVLRAALLASTVYLTGCASTAEITAEANAVVAAQWRGLDAAETCCTEYNEVTFLAMPETGLRFSVDAGTARHFGEDKSYFRGISLPAAEKPGRLLVRAHLNEIRKHGLAYVLRPSIVVLDADLKEIGKVLDLPLCYNQGWSQAETGYFGVVDIDPIAAEKLVLFAAHSSRNRSIHFGNEATTAGGGAIVTVNVNYQFPLSPVGDLEVLPLTDKMAAYLQERCPQLFPLPE